MNALTVGIVCGVITATIVAHIINQRIRKKLRVGEIAKLEVDIQNILDNAVFRTLADRALLIKLHNGGLLLAGVPKYITILQESNSDNLKSVKKDFQQFKVDPSYMQMIDTLVREGIYIQEVVRMPEGFLKRRYEYEGIKATVIFSIAQTKNGFYYGSISTTKSFADFIGSHEYAALESIVNTIRNKYKKAKKLKLLY